MCCRKKRDHIDFSMSCELLKAIVSALKSDYNDKAKIDEEKLLKRLATVKDNYRHSE